MASSKRKKHGAGYVVLIAVLILVLLAVVAAATGYSLVARRVKALQAGAAFTFDYEITSTADSPALYTILQKTGSTKGTVNGLYAPDALQLSISAPDAVIPAGPLTRVYISSSETNFFIIPLSWSLFLNGNQTEDIITVRNILEVKAAQLPAGEPSAAGLEPWQLYLAGPAGKPAGCGHHSHQPAGHDRV